MKESERLNRYPRRRRHAKREADQESPNERLRQERERHGWSQVGGPNCAHLVTTRLPDLARHFAGNNAMVIHELNEDGGLALLALLAPESR
jgi:hypothetical protein